MSAILENGDVRHSLMFQYRKEVRISCRRLMLDILSATLKNKEMPIEYGYRCGILSLYLGT